MSELYLKIGNSNMALWNGRTKPKTLPTDPKSLNELLSKAQADTPIFVCSVVPKLDQALKRSKFRKLQFIKVTDIPIRLKYRKGLGIDRALNLYELAHSMPGKNILVIDFGTAMTADFLSKTGRHLGGWIAPGLALLLKSLNEGTAQLPRVARPTKGRKRLGASTTECMGFGVRAMLEGFIESAKSEAENLWGQGFSVVTTGGGVQQITAAKRMPLLSFHGMKRLCTKKPST